MSKLASKLFATLIVGAASFSAATAQSVTAHIMIPNFQTGAIVANPVTNMIYAVSNSGIANVNDTVSVINGKTDALVANISVPGGAYYPAVDILTNKIYVAGCNDFVNPAPCTVTVIDGKTDLVVATIPVSSAQDGFLGGITVNPVTCTIYVADSVNGDIAVINAKTNTLTRTISLPGEAPDALTVNPVTNELYVTVGSDHIYVINTKTNSVVPVSTGTGTVSYNDAVDLLTGRVLVTNTQLSASPASTMLVLDRTGKLIAQVPVGLAAYGVDVDPITNLIFTANGNDNSISVVSGRTNTLQATIAGTYASFLTVNPITRKVYAVGNGMVTVATE